MNPSVLMGLVPCFTKLVSLNLRMTLAVDQVRKKNEKVSKGVSVLMFKFTERKRVYEKLPLLTVQLKFTFA
jgi:hypothetical protein